MAESRIFREKNSVVFQGKFQLEDLLRPLAGLHQAIQTAGYRDLVLDFSACTAAFAGPMLAICAQVMKFRQAKIDVELILPRDKNLARLFQNTGWAHFIEPRNHPPSQFKGYTQVPATQFANAAEQQKAVNRIVNAILGAIPDFDRKELAALEWSINEITDNVLNHSQSRIGGLVQVSTFQRTRKRVEYIVADAGIGIPTSLRESHPQWDTDAVTLEHAIQEGVTRNKSVGQGNGLFGSYRICSHSKGFFQIESGYGKLPFAGGTLSVKNEKVPFEGTLVAAQIDFSVPHLLQEALQFGGKAYVPVDFVELKYEQHDKADVYFRMKEESSSFGSRIAGAPVRNKLLNLARMCPGHKIIIDFSDVPLVSSSFADEVLGKLFVELGAISFMSRFELRGVASTVKQLVDRAIAQRMSAK